MPAVEKIRFVNSGTEATMSAIRLARGATGRDRIIKFAGNYHGHSDSLLVAAGSSAATLGVPNSPGVTKGVAKDTIILPYNNAAALEQAFVTDGKEIAAVIFEPVAGNMGVVVPHSAFLDALQTLPKQYGSLLICDEVMTGFRVGYSGAQALFGFEARYNDAWENHRRRFAGWGVWRNGRNHGPYPAARKSFSSGDAQRKSTSNGGRHR